MVPLLLAFAAHKQIEAPITPQQSLLVLFAFGSAIAFLIGIARSMLAVVVIDGASMHPTLQRGDRLLTVRKLSNRQLRRGQVVVGRFDRIPASRQLFELVNQMIERGEMVQEAGEAAAQPLPLWHAEAQPETFTAVADDSGGLMDGFVKRIVGLPGDTVTVPLASLNSGLQSLMRPQADADGNLSWHVPTGHCFVRGDGSVSTDSIMWGAIPQAAITEIGLRQMTASAEIHPPHSTVF